MPRYVRVLDTAVGIPRVSDTLAEWVDVDDLITIPEGGGSLSLEIPAGEADGENGVFTFVGTPIAVFRNGVLQGSDVVTIAGKTATFDPVPADGDITGLVQ